jgi:hypothetical protein
MEILPSDLGGRRGMAILAQRARSYNDAAAARRGGRRALLRTAMQGAGRKPGEKPRLGPLGRFWTRGTGMDDQEAAEAVARMGPAAGGMAAGMSAGAVMLLAMSGMMIGQGHPEIAAIFGAQVAFMASMAAFMPRTLLRRWHGTPVSAEELDTLIGRLSPTGEDALERQYLTLVREAMNQDDIPAEAQPEIRGALRSLGQALDRLPPLPPAGADPAALREELAAVRARAAAETDPVIQASLERQADALERSAASADRSSLLLRRTAALRAELSAQTEALRLGLASFYGGGGDISGLAHLSETVRSVAAEAASVADARAEVDAALGVPPTAATNSYTAPEAEAQTLRAGASR